MKQPDIVKAALVTTVAFIILLIVLVLALKPTQEQVTEEILDAKEDNETAYLTFIADNIVKGGPNKDGIPSIDNPEYRTVTEAELYDNLRDEDTVFGVDYGGKIFAIPKNILYWHEILNEKTADGRKISVTYCPLTGSIIGYLDHELGVSGGLYNSNLVIYDRATDSLYPQILGKGVTGSEKGNRLETFPVAVVSWKQWKNAHPDTLVLSRKTGYQRTYDDPPYQGYETMYNLWFPVAAKSDEFHTKKIVHGIEYDGASYTIVKENVQEPFEYDTGNGMLRVTYNEELDIIEANVDGMSVKHFDVYWFAWYAYHPDTAVLNK